MSENQRHTDGTPEHLVVFDTTLRDGEQSPGISLDAAEKLEIAEQLARVGVDYIEAGFPVASVGDFEAVEAIARSVGNPENAPAVCGLSRTQLADVDRCWDALRDAGRGRIHVFISTSPQHMEHMLKMTREQVVAETRAGVARAREHTSDVEFSPQDATRTPSTSCWRCWPPRWSPGRPPSTSPTPWVTASPGTSAP